MRLSMHHQHFHLPNLQIQRYQLFQSFIFLHKVNPFIFNFLILTTMFILLQRIHKLRISQYFLKQLLSCFLLPIINPMFNLFRYVTIDQFHQYYENIWFPIYVYLGEDQLDVEFFVLVVFVTLYADLYLFCLDQGLKGRVLVFVEVVEGVHSFYCN